MNEARSSESCRMVSVSPWPPSRTSWWATRPATRTEWTWMSSTTAPRAPGRPEAVTSGGAPSPAAWRASLIMAAVRSAVPEGASALAAWCSSMTSAESKKRAAWAAKRIIRMAPTEKFGTMSTRGPGASASQRRTWSSRSSLKPEVPTTVSRPWSIHHRRLSMTTPGWVKSTRTSHRVSTSSASPSSTSAAIVRSSVSLTARQTSLPIRPREPSTPTLIMALTSSRVSHCPYSYHRSALRRAGRHGVARAGAGRDGRVCGRDGPGRDGRVRAPAGAGAHVADVSR